MSVFDEDLCNKKQHAFFEIERPDVNGTCVLDIIIEFFLRFQNGDKMTKGVCMLYQVYETIRFQVIVFPLVWP